MYSSLPTFCLNHGTDGPMDGPTDGLTDWDLLGPSDCKDSRVCPATVAVVDCIVFGATSVGTKSDIDLT